MIISINKNRTSIHERYSFTIRTKDIDMDWLMTVLNSHDVKFR